jgi:O-6-methylguanine DNA methyltransferase
MTITLGSGRKSTPAGVVRFATREDGAAVALGFEEHWGKVERWLVRRFGDFELAAGGTADLEAGLDAYLAGELDALDAIAVDLGGTELQRRVWAALRTIPAGQTRSYAQIAIQVGAPRAVRAVGAANGANPVSIVVPCHRVIASDGTLHGYGGGLPRKQWLLEHESSSGWTRTFPKVGRAASVARAG